MHIHRLACLLSAVGLAGSAFAADGVLEINQTCAVETGCFSGDTAGLPVTISAAGSYRLTSNLVVPNENTVGIQVSTDNVSIDLAGFEIGGPVVCSGDPLACTPSAGFGSGVKSTSPSLSGISVRNGSIRGMGQWGVLLGVQAEAANLRVHSNALDGISVDNGSIVSGNTAYSNGRYGIVSDAGTIISGNAVYDNGSTGINAGAGSTVSGNTVYLNEGDGIFANNGSTVSGNSARDNGADGIDCANGCTIAGNTAYSNGGGPVGSAADGIECSTGCVVHGNSARFNVGVGLNLGPRSGYRENVVTDNTADQVNGGLDAGANVIGNVVTSTP